MELTGKQPLAVEMSLQPFGPSELPVPQPGGVFAPPWAIDPHKARPDKSWVDAVDESAVLCFSCVHGWLMLKHAPVLNIMPDVRPLMNREGYCMFPAQQPGGAPLPLEDRYVTKCNRYRQTDAWQAQDWRRATENVDELPDANGVPAWISAHPAPTYHLLRDAPVMTAQGRAVGGFQAAFQTTPILWEAWGGGTYTIQALDDIGQRRAACTFTINARPKQYRNPQTRRIELIPEDDHVG